MPNTLFNRLLKLLFCSVLCFATSNAVAQQRDAQIEKKIKELTAFRAPEKMHIHLDRPTYLVGETAWFKLWVTDENLLPQDLSSVAYLEIISGDQQAVVQAKVKLEGGRGEGAVSIPPDAPSGYYLVRGYTNWMKNFAQSHFFETHICLLNPFIPLPEPEPARTAPSPKPDLQFFAEGGSAIPGVEARIGFKAQAPDGKGIDFNGKISDQNGHTVATFRPSRYGIGSFVFTPAESKTYSAEITDSQGNRYTFPFDVVSSNGVSLRLKESADELELTLTPAGNTVSPNYHLLVYQGASSAALKAQLNGKNATFRIARSHLKPGVNVLVAFDQNLKPVAERLYFQAPAAGARLDVSTDKQSWQRREKVALHLRSVALPDSVEASVAVYLTDSLPEVPQPSIQSYLLLASELKGQIENPDSYFSTEQGSQAEAIDNLMLTHGWRRYRKEELLSNTPPPQYLPELEGHLITGTVVSAEGDQPRSDKPVFAAYPSMKVSPWVALTDKNGRFTLETRDFTGAKELVFQNNLRADSSVKIKVDSPFMPVTDSNINLFSLDFSRLSKSDLLKRSINMQTHNSYFPAKKAEPQPDSIAFYGRPDFSYYLDDYTRFPTMEEVLSEYVPTVMIRLRRGKYYTRVVETGVHKQLFTEDPLLLMDGIPVFDTDRIIHFDPLKVKKADVVNRMYYLGPLTFPGVVSYSTYTHDLSGFEIDPRALIIAYQGTLEKREFYTPRYDRKQKNDERLADLRNLMFWSPSVKTAPGGSTQLEFFTSDQPGRYRIVVQGLSTSGTPVSAVSELTVTK